MSDNTIDTLSIEIKSSAKNASKELSYLASKLNSVETAVKNIKTGKLKQVSGEINSFSNSLKKIYVGDNVAKISEMTKQINKINNVKSENLPALGETIKNFSSALIDYGKISISNNEGIEQFIKNFRKINNIKVENSETISSSIKNLASGLGELSKVQFNDSNLNKIINSLKRLLDTNLEKFSTEKFTQIANSFQVFGKIGDVSSTVNRLVASIARLASAGEKTGVTSDYLPKLSKELKKFIVSIGNIKGISQEVQNFVTAIAQLANAGNKTGATADALGKLSIELKNFFETMSKAPKVSGNTILMTQALAQLASQGGRVGSASQSISNSLQKVSNIGSKATSSLKKIGNGFISLVKKLNISRISLDETTLSLKDLIAGALAFKGFQQLSKFSKSAIELGSDITEVENVVDVAFGNMSQYAYEFASTATEKFGLSELAAKNYTGTMMAILQASDVAQESAAKMSTSLAGLAGDLASFYNIETDEAFYKIRAGIAGQVMPLRQLGINMTVANLQAYALANGIEKTYKNMTQAEKTLLRYNYLMDTTTAQQGDFARTSGTWANQVRILKLNFQQLSAVIGQGFIAALLPVVKVINSIMSGLYTLAERFRVFMYTLTGYEGQGSQSGIVNEFAGMGDSAEDAASGMDDATDSAKKLKNAIGGLSFDKLNVISTKEDKDKTQKEDITGKLEDLGGLDAGSITDAFKSAPVAEAISEFAKKIREAFLHEDWDELGKILGESINSSIQKFSDFINWDNVGTKITKIVTAFTQTFNSLIDNIDWSNLGVAVGNGINTIVNTLNLLVTGIDFINLGSSFANGINGIFSTVNWENLGQLIGNGFMIPWNTLYGLVTTLKWAEIGTSFAEGVNGIFTTVNFETIGLTVSTGLNGIATALMNFTETVKWDDIAKNLYTGLNTVIHETKWEELGKSLSNFVVELLGTIRTVAEETDWEGLGRGIGQFLSNIDWATILGDVFAIITEVLGGLIQGLGETGAGKVVIALGVIKLAFSTFDLASGVTGLIGGVLGKFNSLPEGISGILPSLGTALEGIGSKFSSLIPLAGKAVSGVVSAFGKLITALGPEGLIAIGIVAGVVAIVANWDKIKDAATNVRDWVLDKWGDLKEKAGEIWEGVSNTVSTAWNNMKTTASDVFDSIKTVVSNAWDTTKETTKSAWEGIKSTAGGIWENMKSTVGSIFDSIKDRITSTWNNSNTDTATQLNTTKNSLGSTLQNMDSNVQTKMNSIKSKIDTTMSGLTTTMNTKWTAIAKNFQTGVDSVSKTFEQLPKRIEQSLRSMESIGRSAAQAFANGFRSVHIPVPKMQVSSYNSYQMGDRTVSVPNFSVNWYATGGFPEDGFFFANHNELVGKFSNGKTVVANNEQIITGISQGVASAINGTLVPILKSMNNGQGTNIHIEMDQDGIFKIVQEKSEENYNRTGRYGLVDL